MAGYIGARSGSLSTTVANAQDITATDTTPEVTIVNNTHEDTDGGREGKVIFKGQQSGGEESTLAEIQGSHDGSSDDEKGDLIFKTNDGNDALAPTERLRINSAGDVLVSSPDPSLTITNTTEEDSDGGRESTIVFKGEQSGGELSTLAQIEASHDGTADDEKGDLIFKTNDGSDGASPTEAMRINSDQNIVIPDNKKVIFGAGDDLQIYHDGSDSYIDDAGTGRLHLRGNDQVTLGKYTGENMVIGVVDAQVELYHDNSKKLETTSSGIQVTGGITSGTATIATSDSVVSTFSGCLLTIDGTGGSGTGDAGVLMKTATNTRGFFMDVSDNNTFRVFGGNGAGHSSDFRIDNVGNVTIGGSLSKGSGSFKIRHPLESKKDTHWLVHSFVEAPQADNIYRGKVTLENGTATQNIDTVAGMTEGTFDSLNREVQCFTTNETGWTAIKGSVSGNILTITAQDDTCTDTISWMVIGERKDEHMMSKHTKWTDSDGKVIIEPELTDTEKEDKTEYLEGVGE